MEQCPECGDPELDYRSVTRWYPLEIAGTCLELILVPRLVVAESLLPTELKGGPRACPHKVPTSRKFSATSCSELSASCAQEGGCTAVLGPGQRSRHAAACLFRPVGAGTRARGAPKQVLSSRFGHVRPEFDLVIKFCGWSTPILL